MKKIILICLVILASLAVNAGAFGKDFGDGQSHPIGDDRYDGITVRLDYYTSNSPGTNVDLLNGGLVKRFEAYKNSSITMYAGEVENEFGAYDNSNITIYGGIIGDEFSIHDNATAAVAGGDICELWATQNGRINVYGIDDTELLVTRDNGTIYLIGSNFEVNGQAIPYGNKLSDYVILNGSSYYGTITGTLANGDSLNTEFTIFNTGYYAGTGDIYVIPEPATILLLGLGGLVLRKRRR